MKRVAQKLRGAHASGVLAMASSPSRTSARPHRRRKDRFGETPKPARETRALPGASCHAFTVIELLIVMAIIIVLAGLVIATSGYVQEKSKRSRAEAEMAALSAALESYKADNGIYPSDAATTALHPTTHVNPDPSSDNRDEEYFAAGSYLYTELSGNDANQQPRANARSYFQFKPQLVAQWNGSAYVRDPFGNAYGYSTAKAEAPAGNDGYNPTFDLWSTAGNKGGNQAKWIKNW